MGRKVVKAVADKSIKHAVLWIRVSSREQKEDYSLDAQKDRLKNYCTQRGLVIVKQFTVVESSTRGEREEFYNMIAFIKKYKNPVALVCDKVDRLQRSFKEYNVLNDLIEKEKIAIHFNTEQSVIAKNAKAHDKLMWNFRITVAQSQTDTMSDNVCRSLEKYVKRENGHIMHQSIIKMLGKQTIIAILYWMRIIISSSRNCLKNFRQAFIILSRLFAKRPI